MKDEKEQLKKGMLKLRTEQELLKLRAEHQELRNAVGVLLREGRHISEGMEGWKFYSDALFKLLFAKVTDCPQSQSFTNNKRFKVVRSLEEIAMRDMAMRKERDFAADQQQRAVDEDSKRVCSNLYWYYKGNLETLKWLTER
jgi:hypothetical protein